MYMFAEFDVTRVAMRNASQDEVNAKILGRPSSGIQNTHFLPFIPEISNAHTLSRTSFDVFVI